MSRRPDGGMATAELAVVLPTLVLIIAAGLSMLSVVVAQVRCVDAAREAARAAARDEPTEVVRATATRAAPRQRAWTSALTGRRSRSRSPHVPARSALLLPSFRVTATAVALREPESTGVP